MIDKKYKEGLELMLVHRKRIEERIKLEEQQRDVNDLVWKLTVDLAELNAKIRQYEEIVFSEEL